MNSNYSTELIAREIEHLFSQVEEFVLRKDVLIESIRYMYLQTSTNN